MNRSDDSKPVRPPEIAASQRVFLKRYRSWQRFHRGPRKHSASLLKSLGDYPDCVLIAGCQRSGTTMLTRVIARSAGFRGLKLTHDDELDAALTLAGFIDLPRTTRFCFQTTYLNERFPEYATVGPRQRLVWVLRNPHSVIHSMVHNWKRFALNELYEASRASANARVPSLGVKPLRWLFGATPFERACAAYVGKTAQILSIRELIAPHQLLVVDYDEVVQAPDAWLPRIFGFVGEPYEARYAKMVRSDSVRKADRMSAHDRDQIERVAMPTYRECLQLRSPLTTSA